MRLFPWTSGFLLALCTCKHSNWAMWTQPHAEYGRNRGKFPFPSEIVPENHPKCRSIVHLTVTPPCPNAHTAANRSTTPLCKVSMALIGDFGRYESRNDHFLPPTRQILGPPLTLIAALCSQIWSMNKPRVFQWVNIHPNEELVRKFYDILWIGRFQLAFSSKIV